MSCEKAITYLAENSGIIAALTQQEILTGDPDFALKMIPEAKYDTSKGHSPRYIRVRTTPPRRTRYTAMLPTGNKSYNVTNPQTGAAMTVQGDKTGRGCSLPAETINYGFDVKQRCLQGKAWEAGPWCIMDLLEKEAFKPLLQTLWKDLPRYGKEDFGRQLLRDVIANSYYLFSVAEGFPMSVNTGAFPTVPTGGPSIGFFRKIETLMRAQGWSKGAGTPTIGGRVSIRIRMSREAIEWAIAQRKKELGVELTSQLYIDDGVWGKSVTYEGIVFTEAELPTRGFLRQTGAAAYEFVEVDPYLIVAADGEGFWTVPNEEFYSSHVTDGGVRYRLIEIAHIIHPKAMERQSLGAPPAVPGKTFTRNFDMTVKPIPDYELADRGCNKDEFWFGYRMLHAYAPRPINPELMTAVAFLAPTNRYEVADPWVDINPTDPLTPVSLAPLADPKVDTCLPCTGTDGVTGIATDPTTPSCSDLEPENGVGVMGFRQIAYDVDETAGNLTLVIERVGGNTGAASCVCTINEGTATAPENFTIPTGFADSGSDNVSPFTKTINWADGEYGPKTVVVPIVEAAGDDDGKQFTAVLGTASGATISGTKGTATITIIDTDNA